MRILSHSFTLAARRWRWTLIACLVIALWLVMVIPSGVDVSELVVFIAPAAALGIFMRWASCAFVPERWDWNTSFRAALVSIAVLPPLLAALVTIAGFQRPEQLLTLFVLGAWIALAVGLLAGALNIGAWRSLLHRGRRVVHND